MDIRDIKKIEPATDIFQIGARNMQNYNLLAEVAQLGMPVMLKRHPGATLRDFLGASEWLLANGTEKVILCERGVNAFATHDENARWLTDLTIIPAVRKYSHLPIIIDPSHACGISDYVPSIAQAAVAAGADGTIVEVHYDPPNSVSDPLQALDYDTYTKLYTNMVKIRNTIKW
jgi:3-deoxy-7-phosphoheptulonate synthase